MTILLSSNRKTFSAIFSLAGMAGFRVNFSVIFYKTWENANDCVCVRVCVCVCVC